MFFGIATFTYASNIVEDIPPAYTQWAWNDVIGWIDFFNAPGVGVSNAQLIGYASSSVGIIAMDCLTSPTPSCNSGNWFVSNDANGNLAGWAWSDAIGWISFCGTQGVGGSGSLWDSPSSTWICPDSPDYQVTIETASGSTQGDFSGWAWNDVIGWISFNCDQTSGGGSNTCGTVDYRVKTSWMAGPPPPVQATLTSNIFDTCYPDIENCGAQINTIIWQGTRPVGTTVGFQIATSDNIAGPWEEGDFLGPGGVSSVTYESTLVPGYPIKLDAKHHKNKRYVRYKVFLDAEEAGSTPIVTDIIINWSP